MRRPGGGFCPTRGIGRITEIHFTDGADLKKVTRFLLSTRGHSRRNSTLRKPIWPSPGPLWISPGSSLPAPGPRGVKGHCQAGLRHPENAVDVGKPRSSRIKPPSSRALESGVHVDPFRPSMGARDTG